jgi:hypothetical protein
MPLHTTAVTRLRISTEHQGDPIMSVSTIRVGNEGLKVDRTDGLHNDNGVAVDAGNFLYERRTGVPGLEIIAICPIIQCWRAYKTRPTRTAGVSFDCKIAFSAVSLQYGKKRV